MSSTVAVWDYVLAGDTDRILDLLENLGFELFANELLHEDESGTLQILNGLEEFREHLGGKLTITLLKALGWWFEVNEMNLPLVIESIHELRDRQAGRGNKKSSRHRRKPRSPVNRTAVLNVVGLSRRHIGEHTPAISKFLSLGNVGNNRSRLPGGHAPRNPII